MASQRKQSLSQDPKYEEEPTRQRQAKKEGRKSIPGRSNSTCKGHVVASLWYRGGTETWF